MDIVNEPKAMQQKAEAWRKGGFTVGCVPTMGFLHNGHLELMRRARAACDRVVVSIFVNPTQFGPNEDFSSYPRDFERDRALIESVGVDVIFSPTPEMMYAKGAQTFVEVTEVTKGFEGASRPGHFRGVATVVSKLFNIMKPHYAYFGEKDFQQLTAVKRMVLDLNMDLTVVGCPTVRETDGLAMSSRNVYLSPEERKAATCLRRAFLRARELATGGETSTNTILAEAGSIIEKEPLARIDYVEICDPETLQKTDTLPENARLVMAVWIGKTRLLDNGQLSGKESLS